MDLHLRGRVIVIAGASRGIGLGIADRCLAEGAEIVLAARGAEGLGRAADALADSHGRRPYAFAGDLRDTAFVDELIARTERDVGPIWGAVGNAGLHPAPLGYDLSDAEWHAGFDQNLGTAFRLARAVLPRMEARGGGALLLISSMAARAVGTELTYGGAKAALEHMTRELASRSGRYGVRVNALSPGPVRFPGGEWEERLAGAKAESWQRWLKRAIALGRCGTPAEIAAVAALMLSPLSSFVNGAIWSVDGGAAA
jgi:3-oxoacyl-[acyl-carrier protein] reductase